VNGLERQSGCVVSWVDTGVAGFTRKTGVFFAYGVDGREFFPALYCTSLDADRDVAHLDFPVNGNCCYCTTSSSFGKTTAI